MPISSTIHSDPITPEGPHELSTLTSVMQADGDIDDAESDQLGGIGGDETKGGQ